MPRESMKESATDPHTRALDRAIHERDRPVTARLDTLARKAEKLVGRTTTLLSLLDRQDAEPGIRPVTPDFGGGIFDNLTALEDRIDRATYDLERALTLHLAEFGPAAEYEREFDAKQRAARIEDERQQGSRAGYTRTDPERGQ